MVIEFNNKLVKLLLPLFVSYTLVYDDPRLTVSCLFVSCWVHCSADHKALSLAEKGCDNKLIYTCKKSRFYFRPVAIIRRTEALDSVEVSCIIFFLPMH